MGILRKPRRDIDISSYKIDEATKKACLRQIKKITKPQLNLPRFVSVECGVRNFWHLSAKNLYTVEPKTATSPCVHFKVAFSHIEIVEIIGQNNREIISSASFSLTTSYF